MNHITNSSNKLRTAKLYAFCLVILCSCRFNPKENIEQINEGDLIPVYFAAEPEVNYGEPFLFTDERENTYLNWQETKDGVHYLRYSLLTDEGWSEATTMAYGKDWFVNWADYPQLLVYGEEQKLSFFLEKSDRATFSYDIRMVSSRDGWKSSRVLHDDGIKAEHGFVSLLSYNENALVAWLDGRNTVSRTDKAEHAIHHHGSAGPMTLRAAVLDHEVQKLTEWELDNSVCDCCQTSASMTENGPVVIYRGRTVNEVRNIQIVRLVGNSWTTPKPVFDDNWKINGCPVNGPRSASNGNILGIIWFAEVQGKGEVKVIFSKDGGEQFQKPIKVNVGPTIGRVDMIMHDKEHAMVIWMEEGEILARRISISGKLGPVLKIAESSPDRSSGFPQMTKSGDKVIFAWTDKLGGHRIIKTSKMEVR